jgi:hypothetical protein
MAVLNQTPFQLPDFAKMAYEKSLVDEEKQRREEERQEAKLAQRQRTIEGFGAKKNYLDKGFALEPAAKQVADLVFQQLQQYGTEYEKSNSQEALANYERTLGQFNQILGTGLAVRQAVDNEIESLRKNPSSFSLESQSVGEQAYKDRGKLNFAGAIENGVVMATDPKTGKRVPATQLSYFQPSVISGVNTLGLVPVDPATQFMNTNEYAQRLIKQLEGVDGVRIDSGSSITYDKNAMLSKGRNIFDGEFVKPAMRDAIILKHYEKTEGKFPSPQERANIISDYLNNTSKLAAAKDTYWSETAKGISDFMPASSVGARTGGSGGGITRNQMEDIQSIFLDSEPRAIPRGTFKNQPKSKYVYSGVNFPFKAVKDEYEQDFVVDAMGVDEDGNFVASIKDLSGQQIYGKDINSALKRSLIKAGLYGPLVSKFKSEMKERARVGKTPPGY